LLSASLFVALALLPAYGGNDADVVRARDLCYRQQYDSALTVVRDRLQMDPSDPAGPYWEASVLQMLMYDSGNRLHAEAFYRASDRALELSRRRLRRNPRDARAHLYYGMAQLNRAYFLGWQQKSVSAFSTLLDVSRHVNAAAADPATAIDSRVGAGAVEFFRASADRYLLGAGLFGSRKRAVAMVKSAADQGTVLKPAAEFLLAYMLKESGDYDGAAMYCRRLLETYPGNRAALRLLRDTYLAEGRCSEAVATGELLEKSIPAAFPLNRYGISENWIICGKAYAQLGRRDSALARFDRIIAWEPFQSQVPWLPNYVREAKRWKRKLEG
jgi:tetratricopeptide (TPR) repeat protein